MATSIVLTGGRSQRFGRDKTSELLGDETLLKRVISKVSLISRQVILSVASSQSTPNFPSSLKVQEVVDIYPDKGPLGGIYSGLLKSGSFYNLVVACDMPFLNVSLLKYMLQLTSGYDVVIPRVEGRAEPLHAIYSKKCLNPSKELLDRNVLRITAFFDKMRVRWIEEDEINKFDPEHLSFLNINTQTDFERAKLLLGDN
jgi:molybdopterin-guanine dinucleotide biosynthesis protein A